MVLFFFSFLYLIHCFLLLLPSSPPPPLPPLQPLIWCFDSPFISATWNGKSQPWVSVHRTAGQLLDSCEHSSAQLTQELDQTCLWSSFDVWICTDCTHVDVSADQGFMDPFCGLWHALVWDLNFLCLCWLETAFFTLEAHGVHLICLNCLGQNWFALSAHWLKLCREMLQICDRIKMYMVSVS